MKPLTAMAAAVCMGALCPLESSATTMRWHVDVTGLTHTSSSRIGLPPDVPRPDFHGYFDADDLDADGVITIDEVVRIDLLYAKWPAQTEDAMLASFNYADDTGLAFEYFEYHYSVVFGQYARSSFEFGESTHTWTPATVTTIRGPAPIPEPAGGALALGGLAVVAWVFKKKRSQARALDDVQPHSLCLRLLPRA